MASKENKERAKAAVKQSKSLLLPEDVEIYKHDVYRMIEQGLLTEEVSKSRLSEIFEKIDVQKVGKIRRSELFTYINNHKDLASTSIKDNIKDCFQSESEKIFKKLQKLRKLCIKLDQTEAVKDIEWIIESLISTDINEPILNEINSEEMEVLKQYSKVEQKVQRHNDINNAHISKLSSSKNNTIGLKLIENNSGGSPHSSAKKHKR